MRRISRETVDQVTSLLDWGSVSLTGDEFMRSGCRIHNRERSVNPPLSPDPERSTDLTDPHSERKPPRAAIHYRQQGAFREFGGFCSRSNRSPKGKESVAGPTLSNTIRVAAT